MSDIIRVLSEYKKCLEKDLESLKQSNRTVQLLNPLFAFDAQCKENLQKDYDNRISKIVSDIEIINKFLEEQELKEN